MADLTNQERLQPSLLDRLTDDEPKKRSESRNDRVLSVERLKQCVLRDLEWLLNTERNAGAIDFERYPEIETSVLNYGRPTLSGKAGSTVNLSRLQRQIHQSILCFEPRIIEKSLEIRIEYDEDVQSKNSLSFQIQGQLFAQPMPLTLFLRTDVDLDSGVINVIEE